MNQLHPVLAKLVARENQALALLDLVPLCDEKLPELLRFINTVPQPPSTVTLHHIEDRIISGDQNDLTIRIYHPNDTSDLPVLMWFHGGGWVMGRLDDADDTCRKLSQRINCIVVSVDYHLAPDAKFPIAVNDCLAATQWVHDHARDIGADPARIAVGGDSAGGNLAACTALQCRDQNLPLIFQFLLVPVIDTDFDRPSYHTFACDYGLTRADMQWFWDCYVPDPNDRHHPYVSPIHADNLSGLAPALVITAGCDPLSDEGAAYANALEKAGVPTHHQKFPGMNHGFFNKETTAPVDAIREAFDLAVQSIQSSFSSRPYPN